MGVMSKTDPSPAFEEAVEEIMRLYKSLPPRPSMEEVEAAVSVLKTVNDEEQAKLEEISKQERPKDVPEELFGVLKEFKKNMVLFQSREQKKEASHLVDVDKIYGTFDELIQRASGLVSGDTQMEKVSGFGESVGEIKEEYKISDESLVKKREDGELENYGVKGLIKSASAKSALFSGEENTEKMNLMKMASVIEYSAKSGAVVLDLRGKLMDHIEWLPVSIGKLRDLTELDLSENRIMALPSTLGGLTTLRKLDLHSNQLINLPDTFGELINLIDLDLHANRLKTLPASFGNMANLMNLDLSLNQFTQLPETIGCLTSLKTFNVETNELKELPYTIGNCLSLKELRLGLNRFTLLPETIGCLTSLKNLNVETNELEELPYTIGNCSSLTALRLDFNQLKALPEAIGKLQCLEILTLHYNKIKGLPTTIGDLSNLKELDVSFNEIESIPENLCFAVKLKKLNVSNNFADLRSLPRSIGNLEMLEELDISGDQIRILPDSFRFLSKLRAFQANETPLEVPPREVAKLGAQAVVQFMADLAANRDSKPQRENKKTSFWFRIFSIFWCSGRKRTTTTIPSA